jgi:hypothetical protein
VWSALENTAGAGRGTEMMSAAILMAGVERASVRSASSDRGEAGGISFAASLDESVGESASLQESKFAGETETELRNVAGAVVAHASSVLVGAKTSAVVAETLGRVKEKLVAAQEPSGQGELKNAVAAKIAQKQTMTAAVSYEKTTASDVGADEVELPVRVEEPSDDILPTAALTDGKPTEGLAVEGEPSRIATDDGERLQLSGIGRPVVQGPVEIAGNSKEVGSAKQTVKPQESAAVPTLLKKNGEPIANAVPVESKPVAVSTTDPAVSAIGQAVVGGIVPRGEIGTTTKDSSVTATVERPSVGVASVTIDGSARKELSQGEKTVVPDIETGMPVADDLSVRAKSGAVQGKVSAVTVSAGGDGDSKMQGAAGSAAAVVHAMAGGAEVSSGVGSGVVVFGSAAGDLIAAKVPPGDAAAHAAGLTTGSGEPQGPGVVGTSMEGVPRMLTATPSVLEVGIQNGTHGWLKVRAEMADGGVVNASVSAASSAGQEMLHRELPALTAYLQEERVAVNAVVVHAPLAAESAARNSAGMADAAGQESQTSDGGKEQRQNSAEPGVNGPEVNDSDEMKTYESLQGVDEDRLSPLAGYGSGGGWLSVRA